MYRLFLSNFAVWILVSAPVPFPSSFLFLFLSFFCLSAYKWMHGELKGNVALQYLAWVTYPMILVMFASLFCHLVSPQAIGKLSITCQPLSSSPVTAFLLFLSPSGYFPGVRG